MLPYRIATQVMPSRLPHIAVDAAGGVHAVYAANAVDEQGRRPAYYAYCASSCDSAGRFSSVALGEGLGDAQIQLTPAGKPRIVMAAVPNPSGPVQHQYWSCDSNCLQPGSWSGTVVVEAGMPFFPSRSEGTQSFALDAQGRPRFVFQSNAVGSGVELSGSYLASCDSACSSAAQWHVTQLDENEWKNSALTINAQGLPRIAYSIVEMVAPYLPVFNYLECATRDCSAGVSRLPLAITTTTGTMSTSTFSMRLTTNGAPRIALYAGTGEGGDLVPDQLFYLSCNASSCTQQISQWGALNLGLPAMLGEEGVDLALDSQNRPRIALHVPVPVDELAYAWCDTQCENSAQGWQSRLLPSAKAAEAEMGLPARMGCPECIPPIPPCPNAYWLGGLWPSMALDRNGNPVIAFEMQLQAGGGACSVGTLARVPRLMTFTQPH
jgi:hypothetical protein